MNVGCRFRRDGDSEFVVWAPFRRKMEIVLRGESPRVVPMALDEKGYWHASVKGLAEGVRYYFRLDEDIERPDPASSFQPDGVHGASCVVDHDAFDWSDGNWVGRPLRDFVVYELHIGTFTPEGTFAAVGPRLAALAELGITALEIMPVAQFPGGRNWGYDGTYPYAVQESYGGPLGLKRLVDECHRVGIAVILDVVFNHFGPEGCYLKDFGPYFTDAYRTPWGDAVNFDGPWSDGVREYFIQNALHWIGTFHVDALRIDAVHAIHDRSARPFLQELADRVNAFAESRGRICQLIAESNLNEPRLTMSRERGGLGLDAQWNDDFHHALRSVLTGERYGYYEDYGNPSQIAKAWEEGFVYTGEYSLFRKKRYGNSARHLPPESFVVFSQNHDQVGNGMKGERLASLVPLEALKLAAASVLLSPFTPLLFMGEEYGEKAPFLYFISHSDKNLVEKVRLGRKEEFRAFKWSGEPPDPLGLETFASSKVNWERRSVGSHAILLAFYKALMRLRKECAPLKWCVKECMIIRRDHGGRVLWVRRWLEHEEIITVFNFGRDEARGMKFPFSGRWKKVLDSADSFWEGPGETLPSVVSVGSALAMRAQSAAVFDMQRGGDF